MPQDKFKLDSFTNFGGLNQKVSKYITGDKEALQLLNVDFTVPGSWTKSPGSSLYGGATVAGRIIGTYEYEKLSGFSQIVVVANTNAYSIGATTFNSFRSGLNGGNVFDFVTFVDTMFAANGRDYFKYDGTNAYNVGLPGASLTTALNAAGSSLSGTYQYAFGYLNTTGTYGPIGARTTIATALTAIIATGITYPSGFGITAGVLYRTSAGGSDLFRLALLPVGTTQIIDQGFTALSTQLAPTSVYFTLAPRYMELYNNRLFLSGFTTTAGSSLTPSSVVFSDIGQPETIQDTSNFEVRTNDGDRVTALKTFNQSLYVFKERSFNALNGDSPSNFSVSEVSANYGCLSNNCVVIYNDYMLFLDRKGIIEYNGAGIRTISTPVEPIFLRMNVNAAKDNAVGIHHRLRNEVWFGIPVDGATFNNLTVVYDYYANAWSTRDGFNPSTLILARGGFDTQTAFYGSYSGSINYLSASLFSHNGTPITFKAQTQFFNTLGQSVTTQWRRLFTNTETGGQTATLTIGFRVDEQDAIVDTRTVTTEAFQSRIDFGIPSKTISMEFTNVSASHAIRIDGFSLEGRLQRKV